MSANTAAQAAERIQCTPAQVRRLIIAGRLQAVDICVSKQKCKPRYRITDEAIEAFLSGESLQPAQQAESEQTPQKADRHKRIDAHVPKPPKAGRHKRIDAHVPKVF